MTWVAFVAMVETRMREEGIDPATVKIAFIDFHHTEPQPEDVLFPLSLDDVPVLAVCP